MLIQPWNKVMYCSLLCLTLHIRAGDKYLPSVRFREVLYIPLFLIFIIYLFIYLFIYFLPPAVALNCFFVWCLYFKKTYKPDQFLVQIKVSFFSNLWFCSSFKSLLLPLKLLFLFVLIFFFFLHVFFCSYFSFSLFCNANILLILLVQSSSLSIF